MINKHIPVMLEEVKSFIPKDKKISVIDATFGAGGYSNSILSSFDVDQLIAIDRDPVSEVFAKELKSKHINFKLVNDKYNTKIKYSIQFYLFILFFNFNLIK